MTDIEFNKLLIKTSNAINKYQDLLELAEEEYEKRFGVNPNDINDEGWIDTFNVGCSGYSFKSIIKSAKFYSER